MKLMNNVLRVATFVAVLLTATIGLRNWATASAATPNGTQMLFANGIGDPPPGMALALNGIGDPPPGMQKAMMNGIGDPPPGMARASDNVTSAMLGDPAPTGR